MENEKASFILNILKYEPSERLNKTKNKEDKIVAKAHIEALDTALSALEKQIPKPIKSVISYDNELWNCGGCNHTVTWNIDHRSIYCDHCGQKIDWVE